MTIPTAFPEEPLNYFRACNVFSFGVVEGINNKAKVGMRRAYGNCSDDVLEVAFFANLAPRLSCR